MDIDRVILKPIVTEKGIAAQDSSCYLFWVNPKANKNQIKKAVEEIFGIKPLLVRTMLVKGNTKKLWRKGKTIITSVRKKAIVKLKEGDKISLMVSKKK